MMWKIGILDKNRKTLTYTDEVPYEELMEILQVLTKPSIFGNKNFEIISAIGKDIAGLYGIGFLDRDFKKQDGFKRSIELSKKYGLYRQNYCGCIYSNWQKR